VTELSIQSITKRYDSVVAVHAATLQAGRGELISLLGPSGCGKTTTLRIVAGFERPDAGSIQFDGKEVTNLAPERRDIGMVFQNYALFPHMTVAQNCMFGLEMRKCPKEDARRRIAQALAMVQLQGREERFPRELSGGQQQRVALARALVIEPAILLLDEPLANLDAVLRDEMRFFIRSLQQQVGITTLYVTHDQAEALLISDRVAVMFDGGIAQVGTPRDVYNRPRSRRTASFVGLSNFIEGTVAAHDAHSALIETPHGPVAAAHGGDAVDGTQVTVVVRPEAIELLPPGEAGRNRWRGIVGDVYFLGNVLDCRVRVEDGSIMQVHCRPGPTMVPGEAVVLAFPPHAVWVLPARPS
jgi:putative spermidine/putrescine transport system ATP-binding protein